MKKVNIIYWITTGLFCAFMILSSVPNVLSTPDSVEMISKQMGYPPYIIPFLGAAKLLGIFAILIPGFPKIKEWAYAGLAFDLIGASYSILVSLPFDPGFFGMIVPFGCGTVSYIYHHKRLKADN